MARYIKTDGICLRRVDYSNTSQVASFLTADRGRLSFMAKGVTRAPKKGIRTSFDLLSLYEIVYTERRSGSLENLTDRWLRRDFRGMRTRLERILCGYYTAELALNFTIEGQPVPRFYDSILRALNAFADGRRLGVNVLRLELAALREHGATPAFISCAECDSALSGRGPLAFNPAAGGAICGRCEDALRGRLPGRTTHFRRELMEKLDEVHAASQEEEVLPGTAPEQVVGMSTVLRFHMRYLLNKELCLWKYLQRRKLSRSLKHVRGAAG